MGKRENYEYTCYIDIYCTYIHMNILKQHFRSFSQRFGRSHSWCQDPSIDAWIHWLLRDAPPNGTGMRDCEIQDEELPPTLKLIKVLLANVSIQGFSSPRLQHDPTLLAGVKLRKLRMRMRTDVLQSLTLCQL